MTVLEQLPERVDALASQISQLRDEMRAEFSAVRAEAKAGDDNVIATLRGEFRELTETVKAGNQEVIAHARLLYEDMNARLKVLGEGRRK